MFVTITTGKPSVGQFEQIENFLAQFLPRVEKQPGVVAVYHYARPEQGDDTTIIVWENPEAVEAYRESALAREAMAFETQHNAPASREGYPLRYATRPKA